MTLWQLTTFTIDSQICLNALLAVKQSFGVHYADISFTSLVLMSSCAPNSDVVQACNVQTQF